MKIIQKYLCLLILTLALVCVAVSFSPQADTPLPHFVVHGPEGTQTLSVFDAGNANYYVFLPSYAEMDQVTVLSDTAHLFSADGVSLSVGMDCGAFALETPYGFEIDQQPVGSLWFYRSANVATMYVDTVSGNMKYLHQNKDHKESASVTLYAPDGKLDFSDPQGSFSGRGNATWEYDKRPYTLTLSGDAALLDMAPAAKWVLLANAADETNLNNKLIFDLATRVGMEWTPDNRWVDLYLNGEYSGLYLLTEKVEVRDNRLALDGDAGEFLCRVDLNGRWSTLNNPFYSSLGRTIEITYPKYPTASQQQSIEELVALMEAEFSSGADLKDSPILDLDSWVRRYLIDEISANIDADLASSYFYCSDGKLFAGPAWDYDMTLGNSPRNHDPYAFIAKTYRKSRSKASKYYRALYDNESFYNRMVEIYRTEFAPALRGLLEQEIDDLTAFLQKAAQSNSLRWRTMYDNLPADVVHTPDALKAYFSQRVQFLENAWLKDIPYCTLQFEASYRGSSYLNVSVEKGQRLESSYINTETALWVDSETGEVFDFSQPITRDMIFWKPGTEDPDG